MILKFIKTIEYQFDNVEILNCTSIDDMLEKIKENEVIQVKECGAVYYINSSYIMYFG